MTRAEVRVARLGRYQRGKTGPKWPASSMKRGRMDAAEKAEIERLAATLLKPTPAAIARRIERHPATVYWYMLRHGLIERAPVRRHGSYRRASGVEVRFFTSAEDARLLDLRTQGLSCQKIASTVTAEFGFNRKWNSVRVRLVMLSAAPDEAEAV